MCLFPQSFEFWGILVVEQMLMPGRVVETVPAVGSGLADRWGEVSAECTSPHKAVARQLLAS